MTSFYVITSSISFTWIDNKIGLRPYDIKK